ncbi:PepSY domain-containing protein [Moraxella osloensis]|nr:PepSY domain-containing protein [Moraxella osloensis]MBW4017702.1 PepSY domain-containing protein [Moraxella osloensis]
MNLAKFNPSFLATGLSVALLSVVTGATVTACASTSAAPQAQNMQKRHPANAKHFEQRLQAMQANAQAAANASISASQAVALVQKQTANSRIVGVRYHDSSNRPNPNRARIANNANDNIVGYRVMTLSANGQPQLYIVNASNGQVSQAIMPSWPSRPSRPSRPARPQQNNNPNNIGNPNNNQPPAPPATNISLERAMQLAANQVGGEAIGAHLGGDKGGKMGHGPRDGHRRFNRDPQMGNTGMPPAPNPAQNQPPRTPSYQIEVVKGKEVYHVKVDAQTGAVSDVKSLNDFKRRAPTQP